MEAFYIKSTIFGQHNDINLFSRYQNIVHQRNILMSILPVACWSYVFKMLSFEFLKYIEIILLFGINLITSVFRKPFSSCTYLFYGLEITLSSFESHRLSEHTVMGILDCLTDILFVLTTCNYSMSWVGRQYQYTQTNILMKFIFKYLSMAGMTFTKVS